MFRLELYKEDKEEKYSCSLFSLQSHKEEQTEYDLLYRWRLLFELTALNGHQKRESFGGVSAGAAMV